jgi:hypothetical protein
MYQLLRLLFQKSFHQYQINRTVHALWSSGSHVSVYLFFRDEAKTR